MSNPTGNALNSYEFSKWVNETFAPDSGELPEAYWQCWQAALKSHSRHPSPAPAIAQEWRLRETKREVWFDIISDKGAIVYRLDYDTADKLVTAHNTALASSRAREAEVLDAHRRQQKNYIDLCNAILPEGTITDNDPFEAVRLLKAQLTQAQAALKVKDEAIDRFYAIGLEYLKLMRSENKWAQLTELAAEADILHWTSLALTPSRAALDAVTGPLVDALRPFSKAAKEVRSIGMIKPEEQWLWKPNDSMRATAGISAQHLLDADAALASYHVPSK